MEIAASIAECLISIYFLVRFLGVKNTKYKAAAFFTALILLIADNVFLSQLTGWEIQSLLIFLLVCFVYSVVALNGSIYRKLFSCVLMLVLISVINVLVLNVTALALGLDDVSVLHSGTYLRLLILFITKFMFFLSIKIILAVCRKSSYNLTGVEWAFTVTFFLISCFIGLTIWYINRSDNQSEKAIYLILISGLIVLNILLFFLLQYLGKESLKRKEAALLQVQLKENKKMFEQMGEQYNEIKKIKHDMNGCINSALRLLQDKEYTDAEEYLRKFLKEKTESIVSAVFTDSNIINAVINSKIAQCDNHGIKYKCEITKKLQSIQEFELSIFLSNLFDNAIEACLSVKENRFISLSIIDVKSYLHIVMKNSIEASVLEQNPELKTTKKDNAEQHGYGLKSIKDIVKKYNGDMKITEKDGYFIVDVILGKENCSVL